MRYRSKRLVAGSVKKSRRLRPGLFYVSPHGAVTFNTPAPLRGLAIYLSRHRLLTKTISLALILLILFTLVNTIFSEYFQQLRYQLSPKAQALVQLPAADYSASLRYDERSRVYRYNADYQPGGEVAGQSSGPVFSADFYERASDGVVITDPVYKISVTVKPEFGLENPKQIGSQLQYPLVGKKGAKLVTLGTSGFKEDVLLDEYHADQLSFDYRLILPDGIEARLEKDSSVGFYGAANTALLGNVSTGSEADAELLDKARERADKTTLIFKMPAPFIREYGKRTVTNNARFELDGNKLRLFAYGLKDLSYPISVDPTIYVETARKLMRGNNETNTDFDVDNELIQKSQTTGARIDAWEGNLDMDEGIWDHSTAVAGGYIYRSGGRTGLTKPVIADQQATADSSDGTTFQMSMPVTRPAGDLYIALMCHDGTVTVTPPAGWTEYADVREHAAYYKVGTDAGGGNEAASYTWTGSGSEAWYGVIIRVTGFNASDPVSGTASTGSSTSDAVPVLPAVTPDGGATLVIRATGVDNDTPTATGWVPSGHTKIDSGHSGGTGCGFASVSLNTPPVTGMSSGTATLEDTSLNDTYGVSSIAINPSGVTTPPIIQGQASTTDNSNGVSFTMNMPNTRPAGDLYVALMCHDGNVRVNAPTGGGWTEYADLREHAAYYKIGTDAGGGNEAASYTWNLASGTETFAGVIIRITGFDSSDIISGTVGTGSSGSNATPVYPSTTPDTNKTLVIRSTGIDDDVPSATAWLPAGHTKIDSSTSGGTGDCGFTAALLNNAPVASVATGTATLGEMSDTYGASSIAINAATASTPDSALSALEWAEFNSSTLAIESPNPGTGACTGWCTEMTYNLPSSRRGHSMVAYNGYLYVIGGVDGSGNRVSTIYVAKLGANGEPQLWHPTDTNKDNWVYWYEDTDLNGGTARSYFSAVAYNNRLYILGGQTNASTGGTTTLEYADIKPNGLLSTWTSGTALPSARHGHTAHMYNDVLYLIGGNSSGTLQSSVHYAKINSDGSLNSWTATASFDTARSAWGGSFTTVWGAYIYLSGGCTAVNGSGYCTNIATDTQIGSINADGTISEWGEIAGLSTSRIGYHLASWQGGLYRLGGCTEQDNSTGKCLSTLADVDYGVINPAGEVSTVSISVASGSAPCSGGSPYDCNLPPPGDDAGEAGQMLSMSVVLNGYLYVIGGCIDYNCNGTSPAGDDANVTGNTAYVAVDSSGRLTAPTSCGGTSYGAWCVDATNRINGTTGVAAGGVTTFNNRIYVVGGLTGSGLSTNIYYNTINSNGSLAGAWSSVDMTTAGIAEDVAYTYAYARANPASAGTNPGNMFVFGGCGTVTSGAGCGSSDYETEVYKCNITTTGSVSGCSTSGQLQIDSTPPLSYLGDTDLDGLGIHSGTVYANYVYLIGGYSQNEGDKDDVIYAKIDNSNNIVAASGSAWIESTNKLSIGRRRGFTFGYNGHIYSVGGYDDTGTGIIPFIEWSRMNVSDGSIDPFVTSSITINQRWGLSMVVTNSYAYVIGGCDIGASPSSCSSFEDQVQTFQLYNNYSGAVNDFTVQSDQTFTASTDRWGASAAIYNGYIYVAGGCISSTDCTDATNSVEYAPISASDGSIGTWAAGGNLPADRAWGSLEVAGGTLYYIGGQDDTSTNEQSTVYYTSSISSGNPTWNGTAASNGLPAARTKFGSAVWNNRLYVVGGLDGSAAVSATVYVSPQLSSGGDITSAWTTSTSFSVARTGHAVTAYANNLYVFGGFDGTNYLSDVQFTQINSDGTVDSWLYTASLSSPLRDARAVSANGYIYLVGGRSAASTCLPKVMIAPISANTTIATGNNPTGLGEWYETNIRYDGGRYGAAVAYAAGKFYTMGGGCSAPIAATYSTGTISQSGTTVTGSGTTWTDNYIGGTITYQDSSTATIRSVNSATSLTVSVSKTVAAGQTYSIANNRHFYSTVRSQPQVAIYSRMMDTDTDVFPNSWLMNGVDNFIGARWQVKYRSMNDIDGVATDCGTADMSTWGQETNYGEVTLGDVAPYVPKDGSGNDIDCARYFYFYTYIDASKTFGYPEDVNRGPTITDLSLFFTSDPSKRLRHGKTFTGGEQQPLDTPCRQTNDADCPLP